MRAESLFVLLFYQDSQSYLYDDVDGIYKGTVCAINDIINYDRKVKKGEFE